MKHFLLLKLKNRIMGNYPRLSYSRGGEDIIVEEILGFRSKGFYIDIGAFDPVKFSNTYKFYLQGWRGINIDASAKAIEKFKTPRKRDININCAVGEEDSLVDFYCLSDPSMNTTNSKFKNDALKEGLVIKETFKIQQQRLETIFNTYISPEIAIDFMSVDVEGADLSVLKSNNWIKYRPKIVIVETKSEFIDIKNDEIVSFMIAQNYKPLAYSLVGLRTGNTIFTDNTQF